ncbi:MAG: chorismate transformation enzyme, FkbO/Hyg5 family [Wenzhouxiangella sp.]
MTSAHPSSHPVAESEPTVFAVRLANAASSECALLRRFGLDPAVTTVDDADLGLVFLGGDLHAEAWLAAGPVEHGQAGDIHFARSDDFVLATIDWPEALEQDAADSARRAYEQMINWLRGQDCRRWLRAWNFLPAINLGEGDQERYRRFCVGRGEALVAAQMNERNMCAATAIGGDQPRFRLQVLAGRQSGQHIENPRQVSAYDYPRAYGPRSPAFARATAIRQPDGGALLLVSGTASVVGHETRHDGDTLAQLDEILVNLEALLVESARRLDQPALVDAVSRGPALRVYVRHPQDWPAVQARLRQRWPTARLAGLRGDVCRADLLVEVEAVFST